MLYNVQVCQGRNSIELLAHGHLQLSAVLDIMKHNMLIAVGYLEVYSLHYFLTWYNALLCDLKCYSAYYLT